MAGFFSRNVTKKIFLLGLSATTSLFLPSFASADIINGRFGVNQVFDVQRSPALPSTGQAFNLSGFQAPYRDNFTSYNIGTGYIQFFYTGDSTNLVGIRLFDASDNLIETISAGGDVYGIEPAGFFYESDLGNYGTFVSNNEGFAVGGSTSYITTSASIATLTQLQNYNANTRVLGVGQTGINGGTSVLAGSITNTSRNFANGAAKALDSFVTGGSDTVLEAAFTNLTTDQQRSDAVIQTLPVVTGGTTSAVLNTIGNVTQVVQARSSANTGLSSGEGFLTEGNAWFKPFYSQADQNNEDGIVGFDAQGFGGVVGADTIIDDDLRMGLALSYSKTMVDSNDGRQNVDIDSYNIVSYGSYSIAANTEANFQIGGGYNRNDAARVVSFGGINRMASAEYDSWNFNVSGGVGHVIAVNEAITFIPAARIDYSYITNDSYSETGAGGLNLNVSGQSADQLVPEMGAKIIRTFTDALSIEAYGRVGYDLLSSDTAVTSSFVGGGAAFQTDGITPSPWRFRSGAAMNYQVDERVDISLQYDREDKGSDFNNQTASINIKFAF